MTRFIIVFLILTSTAYSQSIVVSGGTNRSVMVSGNYYEKSIELANANLDELKKLNQKIDKLIDISLKEKQQVIPEPPKPVVRPTITEVDHSVDSQGKDKLSSDAPVQKSVSVLMSHSEMVALHNRLHGGGSWTWPGDLASHLKNTHIVSTVKTVSSTSQPVVQKTQPVRVLSTSNCPNGVCPNPVYRTRPTRRNRR